MTVQLTRLSRRDAIAALASAGALSLASPVRGEADAALTDAQRWAVIDKTLNGKTFAAFTQYIAQQRTAKTGQDLYFLQGRTYDLVLAAMDAGRADIVSQCFALYMPTIETVVTTNKYMLPYPVARPSLYVEEVTLAAPAPMWLEADGREKILYSSQFLFLLVAILSKAARAKLIGQAPYADFARRTWPLVTSHLSRWISGEPGVWQVAGWDCGAGNFNHVEFLNQKINRAFGKTHPLSYCNSVTDMDLWVIAMAAEALRAHAAAPSTLELSAESAAALKSYLSTAMTLLGQRSVAKVFSANGPAVSGLVFDPGAGDDYPDTKYAGYESSTPPTPADAKPSGAGWDFSHGTRQRIVFSTLHDCRSVTGQSWPGPEVLVGYARGLVDGVYDGTQKWPRFRNYFGGQNGWFGYDPKTGGGFAPWMMSYAALTGGWGAWTPYDPGVKPMLARVWDMVCDRSPEALAWRKLYYPAATTRGESLELLPFLCTYPVDSH